MTTTLAVRGQTVVPAPIRHAYRLKTSMKLEWVDDGRCIRVIPLGRIPLAMREDCSGRHTSGKPCCGLERRTNAVAESRPPDIMPLLSL